MPPLTTLATFCDWCAHNSLEHKKHIHILNRITRTSTVEGNNTMYVQTEHRFERYLGRNTFINELSALIGSSVRKRSFEITPITMGNFFFSLLEELVDCPISIHRAGEDYVEYGDASDRLGLKRFFLVTQINIVPRESGLHNFHTLKCKVSRSRECTLQSLDIPLHH